MSTETAPSEGALTLDQATTALMGNTPTEGTSDTSSHTDTDQGAAPELAAADPTEQAPVETSDAGEPTDSPAEAVEGEQVEAQPEPVAAHEPPPYWSKDAKATFAELTPAQQAVVLAQEGPREAITAKVKAEAAEAKQAAEAERAQVHVLAEQLTTFLPEAIETFQKRWGEPDWEATIQQYGAEQAALLQARYNREQAQLQQLAQAQQQAKARAHDAYVQTEWARLAEMSPELAPDVKDPSKGAEKRQEVVKYLTDAGIGRDAVAQISAQELSIAHKAMLWDRAQAAAKAGKPPVQKPAARPPTSAARPGAAPASSPTQRTVTSAQNAFNAKPSLDNAVALLLARNAR